MLYDAHFHIEDATILQEMEKQQIAGIANAASKTEYQFLKAMQKQHPFFLISAGIHPWYVSDHSWEEMQTVLEEAPIIGEIGLDNVWCKTAITLQKNLFNKQLSYASNVKKPVILHVKGLEEEALSYICQYPNTYIVHWLSCEKSLPAYLKLGCYFTIGPSVDEDPAVQAVAKLVPDDRILIETDGLQALNWCKHTAVDVREYASFLRASIKKIAQLRDMEETVVETMIEKNYLRLVKEINTKDY